MLLTDPALELTDARTHLVAPYKIWDWVAAVDTEPCFIVSTRNQSNRQALFTTVFVSSVKRLLEYAGPNGNQSYKVYLLQKDLDDDGRQNLRFEEILGVGIYQDMPAGVPYFAHLMRDGSYRQTYEAQPALENRDQVRLVASFCDYIIPQAA